MQEYGSPESPQKLRYVTDRYRVQRRLGQGGIAEVYHVVDEVTQKEVALKILSHETSHKPHLAGLFEREFHTLAQLAHPRIIEVYDYGLHLDRAYYTMEMLEGSDLRKLAPMEWRQACGLLRDVSSSLSLLHSRKLVHRDISARNVRCDKNGRAKLIDFGALSPLGMVAKLIGTAAFIAPEALNHQPLDQRTDLYALGALAYLLITGKYAYRAHYVRHLKDAWRSRPASLTELKPEVPKPLSDLVMSMLSLDRMARPVYASDVVEMLSAYAGLEPDDTVEVKQAYLATPKLVGRSEVATALLKRMIRLFGGSQEGTLLFEGPSGIGRSRLLAELVLEGKVIGATVLTVGAEASRFGAYGVALELTEQLFENVYDLAIKAITPHLDLLREAFPSLASLIQKRAQNRTVDTFGFDTLSQEFSDGTADFPEPIEPDTVGHLPLIQSERNNDDVQIRPQIQKALLDLYLKVAAKRRLIITVDDFHLVDEPSAAFLASLALEGRAHTLMVAVSVEQDKATTAFAAYQTLLRIAHRIEVTPLRQNEVISLLRSIFGEAPNIQLLAERLYGISKGNPRAVMQLAQHLVDRGVVSYRSGSWSIPGLIDTVDLPDTLIDALRAKLKRLSNDALTLVKTLALSTARNFSFEECRFITEDADTALLTRQLNLLVASEILSTDGQFYSFSSEALKGVLIEELDESIKRGAHLMLAKLFQLRDPVDFRAVQHLIKAGQHHGALDLLIAHIENTLNTINQKREAQFDYIQSLPDGWSQTIEKAMQLVEKLARPKRERYLIHYFFVRLGSATGLVQKDDFKKVIDQLYRDSGLDIFHETGDLFETATQTLSDVQTHLSSDHFCSSDQLAQQRLQHALKLVQQRYDDTDPLERGFPPQEAIALLPGAVLAAAGLASTSFEYSVLQMLPSLEPLFPLSPVIKVLQEHVQATACMVGGCYDQARQKYLRLLEWVASPESASLDPSYREYMLCSFNFAVGQLETVGIPSALERADTIDQHPIFQVNAWLIRMVYYLRQGDIEQTQKCQQTLELLRIQNGFSNMFEGAQWFPMLTAYAVFDDLSGVNQAMNYVERMSTRFDGWVPIFHYARGERHRIRGEYSSALQELTEVLDITESSRDMVWIYAAGAVLKVLTELNRLTEAHTLALEYLERVEQAEMILSSDQILLPLAIIEVRLGQEESAERRVERVIAQWNEFNASGGFLGWAYEVGARVAIYSDRPRKFRQYAKLCKEQYKVGQHPLLTAKYNQLMEDARLSYLGMAQETKQVLELTDSLAQGGEPEELATGLQDYLAKYQGEQELFKGVLDLMIKRTSCSAGYLYMASESSLKLVVQIAVQPPPEQLVQTLQVSLIRMIEEDGEVGPSESRTETATATATDTGDLYSVASEFESIDSRFLLAAVDGRSIPVGAVILRHQGRSTDREDRSFFDAIALCLYQRIHRETDEKLRQAERTEPIVEQGRYLIEALLGQGGMASVYEVRDRETGERMALKRARIAPGKRILSTGPTNGSTQRDRLENCLRREYQMLKSLVHPRIVEVFDFGVDQEGPYYTMELLEGASLRQKAPMDWKEACSLLRDLVSALAFLHARRLLHRDVSPRNVGMTADNHIKLMDFGTTSSMGIPKDRVGTPPFIPPEVVFRQKLDHRSDLYSFGALAYWLLTGRYAYPARNPSELIDLWRTCPPSVSEVVAKIETLDPIPEALGQLVMSLLNIDPLARPSSAAEVLERLSAIATLPIDEQLTVPQAYLTTPTLLGRQQELLFVRKQVIRSLRRRGGTILIQGASGMGRSRFLDASVMAGKLAGMVVLKAEARRAGRSDYAVVRTLARQLMEEIPDIARSAATPYLSLLARILPELGDSVRRGAGLVVEDSYSDAETSLKSTSLQGLRPQMQVALRDWIEETSSQKAVMLAVDDLHLTDEPSAALLALLSQVTAKNRLIVVVTTVIGGELTPSAIAIDSIRDSSTQIEVKGLDLENTKKLLGSVFGQACNVRLLADRLYALSQGNPGVVMQLAQHLVDTQVIRYQGGAWILPDQIDGADLPSSLKDTLETRLQKLDADALQLAQVMALSPEQSFIFEECLVLAGHRDAGRLALSIDELLAFEIIMSDGERYTSSHAGWVSVLQQKLDACVECEGHIRLAEVFDARSTEQFRVGYHLIRAGEEERAVDVLLSFSRESKEVNRQDPEAFNQLQQSFPHDWFQTLRAAIDLAKHRGRPPKQIYLLQSRLSAWGAIVGMVDRHNTQELFDRLYCDSGLGFYYDLRESLGEQARLQRAFELVQQQYDATPESERVLTSKEAIHDLATTLLEAISASLIFADYSFWKSFPSITPFSSLSPTLSLIDKLVRAAGDDIGGRPEQYYRKSKEIIERLNHPDRAGFDGVHYQYLRYGMIFSLGIFEASMGWETAFERAAALQTSSLLLVNAWRIREIYYLYQGAVKEALDCKKQVETLHIQNIPSRTWIGRGLRFLLRAYCLADDLSGLKNLIDEVEKMTVVSAAWIPTHLYAKGEYHRIRGDYSSAMAELEEALRLTAPGRHQFWAYIVDAYLRILLAQERNQQARSEANKFLKIAESADLGYMVSVLRMSLAVAQARLKEAESALENAKTVVHDFEQLGITGLNLGIAYETCARVAILLNDEPSFAHYVRLCAKQFRKGGNSCLIAKYEKLIQEARQAELILPSLQDVTPMREVSSKKDGAYREIREALDRCDDADQQNGHALAILAKHCEAKGGYLFGLHHDGLRILSHYNRGANSERLFETVSVYLEAELKDSTEATITMADENTALGSHPSFELEDGTLVELVLLHGFQQDQKVVVGVAALVPTHGHLLATSPLVIHAISDALLEMGQVTSRIAA